ncbi:MAG: hypothetical protein A3H32_08820 [Betaproteobacteria bacterium RIFCSPLOWO2_02_FULL_63_19]|nr:MAG: hypothetical protein A3H32_08820 [Betaproteobacteria bacterium RIFCSPLOWO2_02_FULL_63_19]
MKQALRLLIIDDSPDDIELVRSSLSSQGYRVESTAVDTPMAMRAALNRQEWDLITCDHAMPGFNAPAALAIAKELCPDVPFIIVSGEIDLNLAVDLIKSGARDYVQKNEMMRLGPVSERELREARAAREHKLAEEKLRETQELFQAIVENVGDLVAVLDTEGRRIYNSPSYKPLFREQDIRPGSLSFTEIHSEDRERIKEIFHKTVATGVGERAEFRFVLKDGSIRQMESEGRVIKGADGKVSRVVVVSRDITKLKRQQAELWEMAATDFLTGLPNRRYFLAQLEQEMARVHRIDRHCASVLMIDADHFKQVNDTYGHAVGDSILIHLAVVMRNELRKIDAAGRLGGEEFAIILPGADISAAKIFAERLRKKVAGTPAAHEERVISLTVSIGVAAMNGSDKNGDAALVRADRALYRAKEHGRNRVEIEV